MTLNSVFRNLKRVKIATRSQNLEDEIYLFIVSFFFAFRHILYECGKARKSFSCDECGKKVTRQDTLQKHKLIHLVQHLKKKESETDEDQPKPKKMC